MDKRGISQLIVVVLIIGFAIALAAVILTWSQTFTYKLTEETQGSSSEAQTCLQNVDIGIMSVCYNSTANYTQVQVENIMEDDLSGLVFRVIYTDRTADVAQLDSTSTDSEIILGSVPLEGFGLDLYRINHNGLKTPSEIQVLPKITLRSGKQITCEKRLSEEIIYSECV